MKVLYVTNTFAPHVGGVAKSIASFTTQLRRQGVEVLTVAPTFDDMPDDEKGVLRVPAVQNFNGSDFSVAYPLTGVVRGAVAEFHPDVIHSHHPFLLGGTAFRIARSTGTPLVFTHHTMYEQYTHYVPGNSSAMKRFATQLATGYANMCQHVIAPSESIRDLLVQRGVQTPVSVVPTGVDCHKFSRGSGSGFRRIMGIPEDAFVVGHVGRLAREKNLDFLTTAIARFLQSHPTAHFLLAGTGPRKEAVFNQFREAGVEKRIHQPGTLRGPFLSSAYRAMDVFAFASHSETQGMVLTEAMAAGVPVVAVDAPGAREVVHTGKNGILLERDSLSAFNQALDRVANASPTQKDNFRQGCHTTAGTYSIENCTRKLISIYDKLLVENYQHNRTDYDLWDRAMRMAEAEWDLLKGVADAAGSASEAPDSA